MARQRCPSGSDSFGSRRNSYGSRREEADGRDDLHCYGVAARPLVKIGERMAEALQEQLGLPSMTQLKGHIATTGELSNDMKAQMAHTLTDSLKLKRQQQKLWI